LQRSRAEARLVGQNNRSCACIAPVDPLLQSDPASREVVVHIILI
jgi:hypothetical protein